MMRKRGISQSRGIGLLGVAMMLVGGCDNTEVKLADVPPVKPVPVEPPKPSPRIPKGATFSPAVLPGSNSK